MPAIYAIDLIAKRDKRIKMDKSIIKGWNVHYQTLEEVEKEALDKMRKQREDKAKELCKSLGEKEELNIEEQQQLEEAQQLLEEAYNEKTGSYSGNYGKKPVDDELKKQQIQAILTEKTDEFDSALSALQEQNK